MEKLICKKCGRTIMRSQSGLSNWIYRDGYICGICQGYDSDYPDEIISYTARGKPRIIIRKKRED